MHPAVGSVNTSAVQTISKGFMVWNNAEVAVAGDNRTQQSLLQSPLRGTTVQKNAEKNNCSTGKVNKHCVKNGIYGCKREMCITASSLNWEFWRDTVIKILTEILSQIHEGDKQNSDILSGVLLKPEQRQ